MEFQIDLELLKQYDFDQEDFYVLEAQRNADRWLSPAELAAAAGVSQEKALKAGRAITELMMLTNLRNNFSDF